MLADSGVADVAGLRVLDLGCGFGAVSAYFAAHGAEVTGIDPNEERLQIGRKVAAAHSLPVRLVRGRMEELDLPDCSFDVAVQNNSLCYVVDRARRSAALGEALRVLRPGGTLLIRNPNRWHPVDQFTGLPLVHLLPPSAAVRAAAATGRRRSLCHLKSPPAAKRELRAAGFVDVFQPGFGEGSRKPDSLKAVARYQHLVARRPADPPARP
jgi:ubiquinone/menaquinone biosynthesis C-methylase UbiE